LPRLDKNETEPSREKVSSAGTTPGGISDIARCAECEQLKQQYDSTLQELIENLLYPSESAAKVIVCRSLTPSPQIRLTVT
jgi:hypothetical protein